jgi:hypothetical protein
VVQDVPLVDWKQDELMPPESAFHCPCVTSVCPMKKLRERVTVCRVSSLARPRSVEDEPMMKAPAGIKFIPVGAHRSLAVPVGPVAQKPEAHWALSVQAAPRLPMQAPATTL